MMKASPEKRCLRKQAAVRIVGPIPNVNLLEKNMVLIFVPRNKICLDNDVMKYKDEMEVGSFVHTGTGDTRVIGLKSKDEFSIIVAKNYWEDSICEEDR